MASASVSLGFPSLAAGGFCSVLLTSWGLSKFPVNPGTSGTQPKLLTRLLLRGSRGRVLLPELLGLLFCPPVASLCGMGAELRFRPGHMRRACDPRAAPLGPSDLQPRSLSLSPSLFLAKPFWPREPLLLRSWDSMHIEYVIMLPRYVVNNRPD